jgi:hypothetical protein
MFKRGHACGKGVLPRAPIPRSRLILPTNSNQLSNLLLHCDLFATRFIGLHFSLVVSKTGAYLPY